jgi:hypothetical protein
MFCPPLSIPACPVFMQEFKNELAYIIPLIFYANIPLVYYANIVPLVFYAKNYTIDILYLHYTIDVLC